METFRKIVHFSGYVAASFAAWNCWGSGAASVKCKFCEPYYTAIKYDKTPAYIGPGKHYKVACVYVAKAPVVVVAIYDHWRKVRDANGFESWLHKSQLSPKRFVISVSDEAVPLLEDLRDSSKTVAYVKKNVVMRLLTVRGNWCKVEASHHGEKYVGWLSKKNVFGVFDNETQ